MDDEESYKDFFKGLLKGLISTIATGGVVFVGAIYAPQLIESTETSCYAVERRFIKIAKAKSNNIFSDFLVQIGSGITDSSSKGLFARNFVTEEMPNIAPGISCPMMYWYTYIDSDLDILKNHLSSKYLFNE